MRIKKIILPLVLIGFVFSVTFPLQAQEEEDKTFSGNFLFGYRFVDTNGAEFKYKEDLNLDAGVRLFNFNLNYTPAEGFRKLLDRLDVNLYNYGGDPFETFSISAQKYGKYKFKYDRRKATYFYHDLHQVNGAPFDEHTFDFDRVMDSGSLNVWLSQYVDVYLNFDRYTRKGESTTTFDIDRVEFEFDKPVNEDSKDVTVGLNVHLKRYNFVFEEKIQDYENSNSLFLPGFADGGPNARYPTSLDFFTLNQPYDLETQTHTFRFNARPIDSLIVAGSAALSNQKMDLEYSEEASGITYLNRPFTTSFSGEGEFERDLQLLDLDLTLLLTDKLAVVGAARYNDFEQTGFLTVNNTSNTPADISYYNLGFEGGLQYQISPMLALTGGYRFESRKLENTEEILENTVTQPFETVTYEDETRKHGFFGNLKLNPSRMFSLTADYQFGTYDEPFTLISPTEFHRFRTTAKVRKDNFSASGSILWNRNQSEVFDAETWESTRMQFNGRIGYHGDSVKLFAGFSRIDMESKGDRMIAFPPGYSGPGDEFPWSILYEGESNIFDASLAYAILEDFNLGGYFNYYKNNGSWEVSRVMLKGYVERVLEWGIVAQVGYRYVDFKEDLSGFNDYSAHIFEIAFGYRWK